MTELTSTIQPLLQEQVAGILLQPLEAQSVVLSAGPRIFDTASPIRIPRLKSSTGANWVGEGELIDEHDVDFDEVRLMPSDRKSLKTLIKFSNEAVRQSVIGLDAVLKQRLVSDVAAKLDTAFLIGDGADGSVTGILNQPGVQTGPLDLKNQDSLLDALALAASKEVKPNRWFINAGDFFTIRKIKDTSGKYILEQDITKDTTYRLFGVPVTVTNKLPSGSAILADMSQVAVARDLAPSVTVLSERYAEYDLQAIRVVTRFDLGLLHPEGVITLKAE